ncbi:pyridoxal phosphate-dependent decarboxylase family protein [Spongiimicrobium salis]|uniref:pyridoxal phosphate-dependent decarboxylase family protein n=1 Tax=Spongiimicrobium salis TaxID=1667022 RepID=UPI00374CA635
MEKKLLESVYDAGDFRKRGHQLIDELADYLEATIQEKSPKVLQWNLPDFEHEFWKDYTKSGDEKTLFKEVLKHSTSVHHPKYIGHQISPTAPITLLSGMVSALLNNGMAVYEMGMSANSIERIITDLICKRIGYTTGSSGFLTSGGTLANLTALLTARKAKVPHDVWNQGHTKPLGIMVSEEAHYCIERAAKIMGLGEKGIIKVPTTADYTIDTSKLETCYEEAKKNGIHVFALVGSAPSTATGIHDNLEALADFSKKHNLWYHVDAAHGGAAIFSSIYKKALHGIEKSNSTVIDGHKMMMMPGITTALLFKDDRDSYTTFSQKADYLLEQSTDREWYNSGKRTFECTKSMMCLHWYTLLKTYGEGVFDTFVTTLYDAGHAFGNTIQEDDEFELAVAPKSNIVCFRWCAPHLDSNALNKINEGIRQQLLDDGEFYIVQTKLRGTHYLRITIMNPFTTEDHLQKLLERIKKIAAQITSTIL